MGRFCGNCFNNSLNEQEICTICGFDAATNRQSAPHGLPPGTILNGRYIIGRVLGQGGFGITYTARDYQTNELVAVKEFFPDSMATRSNHTLVTPFLGERGENFSYGLRTFLQEAETMAKFIGNANIVRVYSYFEENNTAYFVMEYVNGVSLQSHLKAKGGQISFEEAISILFPIMDALSVVHEAGIIHRDVAPDNIYIARDGTVKLLDFGAARYSLGNVSHSLDVILKHGFAPKEQYKRRGRQGPYTDVYSVGATLYYAITGVRPDDAIERSDEDDMPYPTSLGARITQQQEAVLLKAMAVDYQDRYQTMVEFKNAIIQSASQKDTSLLGSLRKQKEQLKQEALRKKEELRKQEEERRRQEELRKQEEERRRQEELRKQEEERRRQEDLRKQEEERRRQEELRKQEEERRRQEELRKQEEERRRQEELRKQEEERRRQEDLRKQEEERRQLEELRKLENERRRQEELRKKEEIRKQKDLLKQEQLQKKEEARQEKLRRKQEKKAKRKSRKGLVVLLAGAAAAGVLAFVMTQTDLLRPPVATEATQPVVQTEPAGPRTWEQNLLRADLDYTQAMDAPENLPVFGSSVLRSQVETVTFLDSIANAPQDAVDASMDGDRSVLVWFTQKGNLYDMYVAAENGVNGQYGCEFLFCGYTRMKSFEFGDAFHMETAESLQGMFKDCKSLTEFYMSKLNTRQAKNMAYMFSGCEGLSSLNLTSLKTNNAENIAGLFEYCTGLTVLDVSVLNIKKVTNMDYMFRGCTGLKEVDLSTFDAAIVEGSRHFGEETTRFFQVIQDPYLPLKNCISYTIDILETENNPKALVLSFLDQDGNWFEAKQIALSGKTTATETILFESPTDLYERKIDIIRSGVSGRVAYRFPEAIVLLEVHPEAPQADETASNAVNTQPAEPEIPYVPITNGDFYYDASYVGNTLTISGENLKITVVDDKDVTVTLTGLDMKDSYPTNRKETEKNHSEYLWGVSLKDNDHEYDVQTVSWAFEPGAEDSKSPHDMDTAMWYFNETENMWDYVSSCDVKMSYSESSMTWTYTMNEDNYFNFWNPEEISVSVHDIPQNLFIWQTYKKDPNAPALAAPQQASAAKPASADPGAQQITVEDLTFRSDQITPVRMRENGYSLHSVRFLDKPVHNCLSVTAEIEIREGTPDEFILYLQDLDRWYEAGRIKATEANPVIGTVKFSKPVSFNAFAIVPSEGDYATSINYKLIGAEIKGSELQSSRNENTVLYTGDNFTMSIEDNRDVTITLSGLVLLDEYPSLINGSKGTKEYQWSVFITSGDHYFSIVTDCPVPVKNFNKPMVTDWEKMTHTATLGGYVFGELDNHIVKTLKPTVTHTADSIIWKFKLDKNQPFDFESDIGIKVNWFDRAHHLEETRYYYGT